MTKRASGEGSVQPRGENTFRLRYRIDDRRFEKTFHGTQAEARKELRRLLKSGDDGDHIVPTKITVGQWIEQWLDAGAPGRRRKAVSQRTLERYAQLLRTHVKPVLDTRPLQNLKAPEIDLLYNAIADAAEIAPRTQHHVHVVLGALLATAERKGLIPVNPMKRVEQVPNPEGHASGELADEAVDTIGEGLDEAELAKLIAGFRRSSLFPVVALAAASGARRNELLALRWTDLDTINRTLRIERAWEQTKKYGLRLKPPKTKRGRRTISLDDATIKTLLVERERHQRIHAGIPDGADVDLSLIRLPSGALLFPSAPESGKEYDVMAPRNPRNFSKEFARRVDVLNKDRARHGEVGFGETRFHDLRGIHATALLDAGIPVHTVAQRIGDDPAVLLRTYAKRKRTKTADASLSNAIEALVASFLGS